MTPFDFCIITPKGIPFSGKVVSLMLPGEDGRFGVFAHHAALVAVCNRGKLKILDESNRETWYQAEAGFFETANNRAVLLTEDVSLLERT